MKLSSRAFRTNPCPHCHRPNKIVYWSGDPNHVVKAAMSPTLVRCRHCRNDYEAVDAVYYYDTIENYVLSLSNPMYPDSKKSLELDAEVEFNVVSNGYDFVTTLISRIYELDWKSCVELTHRLAENQQKETGMRSVAYLQGNGVSRLMVRIVSFTESGSAKSELKPFDMDMYIDVVRDMKMLYDLLSITDEEEK